VALVNDSGSSQTLLVEWVLARPCYLCARVSHFPFLPARLQKWRAGLSGEGAARTNVSGESPTAFGAFVLLYFKWQSPPFLIIKTKTLARPGASAEAYATWKRPSRNKPVFCSGVANRKMNLLPPLRLPQPRDGVFNGFWKELAAMRIYCTR